VSSLGRQVANQQGLLDNIGGANEAKLAEFLKACAREMNPSGILRVLERTAFRDARGWVQACCVPLGGILVCGASLYHCCPRLASRVEPVPGRAHQGWSEPRMGRPRVCPQDRLQLDAAVVVPRPDGSGNLLLLGERTCWTPTM